MSIIDQWTLKSIDFMLEFQVNPIIKLSKQIQKTATQMMGLKC